VLDVLIANGVVIDGGGVAPVRADIGIEGDRIAAVGFLDGAEARRTIDATGHAVAPGFIDLHTHSDVPLLVDGRGLSKIHQGVTTEVTGNCGYTPDPVVPERTRLLRDLVSSYGDRIELSWTDLAGYRAALTRQGIGVNVAPLVGHSAIRGAVVGFEDRPAAPDELRAMQRLVAAAMDQGAFGLSTGLTLPPSAYGDTEEVVTLASPLAAYPGRFYTSHIRCWAGQHVGAVAEAVEIGRRAGVPVNVSHMAVNEPKHWGEADRVIAVCERGAVEGLDVTFDVYPYVASSSGFSQCVPTWAQSGGRAALVARLRDPAARARIRANMLEEGLFRGWPWLWDRLQVSGVASAALKPYEGMTIQKVGDALGCEPIDAALTLMDRDEGQVRIIFYYRTEEDMRAFLRHPMAMMGSDGSALAREGPLGEGKPHPRSYGAAVRLLGRYARDERLLSLSEAVHKMSGQVADRLGLRDRGRLRVGMAADIVVFDPATVRDRATFEDPHQYADGVPFVLVNGRLAVDGGAATGARAGRVLSPP
jgi:N-acyl-D-aspartate/D-glutamate deacylase